MLTPLTRWSLTVDPLIAEAKQRARERRELIVRIAAAAFILCTTVASAAFLEHLVFVEQFSILLALETRWVHPWWVDAATVALCLLGVAGAANVLATARSAVTSGYTAASALFIAAGVAAMTDTYLGVWIDETNVGRANLAIVLLLLGLVSAVLALTLWSGHRRQNQEPSIDPAG